MHYENFSYETDKDIVALSTPYSSSALCIIRCSGQSVKEKISPFFTSQEKLIKSEGGRFFYGKLKNFSQEKIIDEVVLLYYKSPQSYTGEDMIEIIGHGSVATIESILELCHQIGMREALPGEFTFRSFMHGKIDLTQAEAVHEIISSQNKTSLQMAIKRLSGDLEKEINEIKSLMVDFMAIINLQLDYAEDDAEPDTNLPIKTVETVISRLKVLITSYDVSQKYKKGFKTIILGKTNAGKSSLFNLILREDRSIVADFHGTTRDYVEGEVLISGNTFHLFDTAGLRETEEVVEKEGIRRANILLEQSQIVLYMQEAELFFELEDVAFINSIKEKDKKIIVILNKSENISQEQEKRWEKEFSNLGISYIFFSVKELQGLDILKEMLSAYAKGIMPPADEKLYIDSQRQKDLLEQAKVALEQAKISSIAGLPLDLIALDCQKALGSLCEITGEVTKEDILERMFSSFCVGK